MALALASRCDSAALSITESEAAGVLCPEDALEEERRLEQERHAKEKEKRTDAAAPSALDNSRFSALEQLLSKSELYSTFLFERINAVEDAAVMATTTSAAASSSGAASKSKKGGRKRTRNAAQSLPTVEEDNLTPTQRQYPLMKVELRDYQLTGVRWLSALWSNGLNGILADQMGLGKTVQTIAFLSHLKSRGIHGPFLVVGPLSTLPNWVSEFERFCPALPVLMYHGSKQEREELRRTRIKLPALGKVPEDFPVIVTSYEIIIADSKFLQKYQFKYLVVDEGHRLKNFDCKLIRELKQIPVSNRLLLSGTPLQNNLAELWSLLNFLMPELFNNLVDFEDWFDFSSAIGTKSAGEDILAAEQRNKVVSKLHLILRPFMLRRMKSDVNISLPRKAEVLLYANMSKEQRDLNLQLLSGKLKEGMTELAEREGGSAAAAGNLNNMLMQMRKICNHPDLITAPFSSDIEFPSPEELVRQCGKMQLLDRLLTRLQAGGHKVLIFSQMTKMLDLLQSYLEQKGHRACRIDGSVPWQERQRNIVDFNNDPSTWLFLLSTRAGGLGINLTAADTVIIYDSDWNPHQDLQAMDRCHRIGQTRPVLVLRLATSHSVEGRMLKRAADKMVLERLVIKKGAFKEISSEDTSVPSLSAAELTELLRCDVSLDCVPQSGVVKDAMLDKILDRSYLVAGTDCPYPHSGVGYEVIQSGNGSGTQVQTADQEKQDA